MGQGAAGQLTAGDVNAASGALDAPPGVREGGHGIEVMVCPWPLPRHSNPDNDEYVFAYTIRIANVGQRPATLLGRRWEIIDAQGLAREVEGEGVVGKQPRLEPGASFVYTSYCPLATSWGTMQGYYVMRGDDGSSFRAYIPRFVLVWS